MVPCQVCGKRPPLCDACVDATVANMRGHAAARGYAWADSAFARRRGGGPARWAELEPAARAAAARQVADLGADQRVRELLAGRFVAEAERRYGNLVAPPRRPAPRGPWRGP